MGFAPRPVPPRPVPPAAQPAELEGGWGRAVEELAGHSSAFLEPLESVDETPEESERVNIGDDLNLTETSAVAQHGQHMRQRQHIGWAANDNKKIKQLMENIQ